MTGTFATTDTTLLVICVRCHAVTGKPLHAITAGGDRPTPPRTVLGLCRSCEEQYFRPNGDAFTPNPAA